MDREAKGESENLGSVLCSAKWLWVSHFLCLPFVCLTYLDHELFKPWPVSYYSFVQCLAQRSLDLNWCFPLGAIVIQRNNSNLIEFPLLYNSCFVLFYSNTMLPIVSWPWLAERSKDKPLKVLLIWSHRPNQNSKSKHPELQRKCYKSKPVS